jgi:hypothetical protein
MSSKTNKTPEELYDQGYRVISRKFGIVSRVDREDWISWLEKKRLPVDADWYRRCISKDRLEVPLNYIGLIPNSGHDIIGFMKKNKLINSPHR